LSARKTLESSPPEATSRSERLGAIRAAGKPGSGLDRLEDDLEAGRGHCEIGERRLHRGSQLLRRPPAAFSESGRLLRDTRELRLALALERAKPIVAAGQSCEIPGCAVAKGEDLLGGATVLSPQPLDLRDALLEPAQPGRIRLHAGGVALQLRRRIAEIRLRHPQPLGKRSQCRIELRQLLDDPGDLADQIRRARRIGAGGIPGEPRDRAASLRAQPLGVDKAAVLGGDALHLVGLQPDIVDLADLKGEEVLLAGPLLGVTSEAGDLLAPRPKGRDPGPEPGAAFPEPPELIQDPALDLGPKQRLRLVLAADLDPAGKELRERGDGHQTSAHLSAAPSAPGQGASHHQLVIVDGETPLGELRLELGQPLGPKHGLHHGLIRALSDRACGGPRAGEQPQGTEDDGLARAGLAGHHVQAGAKLELDSVHQGQLLDPEQLDHPDPQPSLVRSTSKRER
jgi:hypothetical protein